MRRRPRQARRAGRTQVALAFLGTALLGTVLLATAVLGTALLGAAPAAAAPSPSAATAAPGATPAPGQTGRVGTATGPLVLTVTDLRPRAPQPGGDLQVVGTLTNTGTAPATGLQLRVRLGSRLTSRGELRQADLVAPTYRDPRVVQALPDLAAGARTAVDLRLAVDDLRLGADGAYPLLLEVRGLSGTSTARTQLGSVATYLPWFRTADLDPLRIAWVWPLVDEPHSGPQDLLMDDGLATSLAPDGRLGRSLTAARTGESATCPPAAAPADAAAVPASPPSTCTPVPVTYAVDPGLLQDAERMTAPYEVAAPGAAPRTGQGTAAATGWLGDLRSAAVAGDVLALPYADPDVVALTRGSGGLAADVSTARTYGVTVTRDVLGTDGVQTVAFPPSGQLTDAAFDAVTTSSTQAVVLDQDAVTPVSATARSTPGTRVELPPSSTSGDVTGLVVDAGLSALLVPAQPQDPRLAEQRWLVETAMIAAELPSRGRTLLVAPPRRGEVDPAVVGQALADTGRVPWMCGVRLTTVASGTERCPGEAAPVPTAPRSVELVQPDGRSPALSAEQVSRVGQLRTAATQLSGAVVLGGTDEAQALRARLQRAWLRSESSAWRDDRSTGARLVQLASADVDALRAEVSVLTGRVTLTSNNGHISVAVVNELDQPVTVAVRLRAPSDARLSKVQTDVLEVPPRTSLPVQVEARTLTSGRFVVKAQLLDRDGVPFGSPEDLVVRSTRYGAVALAVTGLGAAVLLIAAGVRLARRALRRPVLP